MTIVLLLFPGAAFNELLDRFAAFYIIHRSGCKGGKIPKLQYHHQVLGLLMHYYEGLMGLKTRCEVFVEPPTTLQRTLARGDVALQTARRGFYPTRIGWASLEHQQRMAFWVEAREPLLKNVFGFVDG